MYGKIKRIVLLLLAAVIFFSAPMAAPAYFSPTWKNAMQGAALGLMIAGIVIIIGTLVDFYKSDNKTK